MLEKMNPEAPASGFRWFGSVFVPAQLVASGGKCLDEMLAHCGLEVVVVRHHRRAQEWLHDVKHLGIPLSLIALGILFGCPQADVNPLLLSHLLREKGQ